MSRKARKPPVTLKLREPGCCPRDPDEEASDA